MRLRQFSEGAMEDTVRIIQKTFSPERKAVSDKILEIVRAVQALQKKKLKNTKVLQICAMIVCLGQWLNCKIEKNQKNRKLKK